MSRWIVRLLKNNWYILLSNVYYSISFIQNYWHYACIIFFNSACIYEIINILIIMAIISIYVLDIYNNLNFSYYWSLLVKANLYQLYEKLYSKGKILKNVIFGGLCLVLLYFIIVIGIVLLYYYSVYSENFNIKYSFSTSADICQTYYNLVSIFRDNIPPGYELSIVIALTCISTHYLLKNFSFKHNIYLTKVNNHFKFLLKTIINNKWSIVLKLLFLNIFKLIIIASIGIIFTIFIKSYVKIFLFKNINLGFIFLVTYWCLPWISLIYNLLFILFFKSRNTAPKTGRDKKYFYINTINDNIAKSVNIYNLGVTCFIYYICFIGFKDIYEVWMIITGVIILSCILIFIPSFFYNYLALPSLNIIFWLLDLDIITLLTKMWGIETFRRPSTYSCYMTDFRKEINEFKSKKEITEMQQASVNDYPTVVRRWEEGTPTPRRWGGEGFINHRESMVLTKAKYFQHEARTTGSPIFSTLAFMSNNKTNGISSSLGFEGAYWINSDSSNNKTLMAVITPTDLGPPSKSLPGKHGIYSVQGNSINQTLSSYLGINVSAYDFNKALIYATTDRIARTFSIEIDLIDQVVRGRRPQVFNIQLKPLYNPDGFKVGIEKNNKWSLTNPHEVFTPTNTSTDYFRRWNHMQEHMENMGTIRYIKDSMVYTTSSKFGAHIGVGDNTWFVHYTKESKNNFPWISLRVNNIDSGLRDLRNLGIDTSLILNSNARLWPNNLIIICHGMSTGSNFIKFPIISPYSEQIGLQPHSLSNNYLVTPSLYLWDKNVRFTASMSKLSDWVSGKTNNHQFLPDELDQSKIFMEEIRDSLFESISNSIPETTRILKDDFNIPGCKGEIWSMSIPENPNLPKLIFCNSVGNILNGRYIEGPTGEITSVKIIPDINTDLKGYLYYHLNNNSNIRFNSNDRIYAVLLDKLSMELVYLDNKTKYTYPEVRNLQYHTMWYMVDSKTFVKRFHLLDRHEQYILVEFLNQYLNELPSTTTDTKFSWRY